MVCEADIDGLVTDILAGAPIQILAPTGAEAAAGAALITTGNDASDDQHKEVLSREFKK
jgi:hypothetical protein